MDAEMSYPARGGIGVERVRDPDAVPSKKILGQEDLSLDFGALMWISIILFSIVLYCVNEN
jgi:hypothetical protein